MGFFSKLLGKEDEGDKALREAMQMIWKIIDDEKFQNTLLGDDMEALLKNTPAIDERPDGEGAFGLDERNPIPVNGAIGELSYLSRLETSNGERMMFHRIGAINMIDVFEAVTYSGSGWYLFFVDLYHPRRSRKAPPVFRIASEPRQFSGFHNYCYNFPYDFADAKQASPEMLRLAYIPFGNVMPQIEKKAFARPMSHKAKLDIVKSKMSSRSDM